jgi:sarcosine oxidase subunit beta
VPIFENPAVNPKPARAGLSEMPPDHHPILGQVPTVTTTGKTPADLILTGKTDLIDAKLLDLARFADDRMIHETAVL